MLILRVMAGKAWHNDTSGRTGSTVKFCPGNVDLSGSQWLDSDGTRLHVQSSPDVNLSDRHGKVSISEV